MPFRFFCLVIPLLALKLWSSASFLLAQDASTPAPAVLRILKHLEALPVLESLAKQNPDDADVIFAWGVRLETVRARQLLVRAQELGKKSSLHRDQLEAYLSQFVVPPTPASKN